MGDIVVGAAASHTPSITGMPEAAWEWAIRFYAGMEKIRQPPFEETQPDTIIKILNEHFIYWFV